MKKYILAHPVIFTITVLLGIATQGIATATSLFIMVIIDSITNGDMADLVSSAYLSVGIVLLFFISLFAYTRLTILYSFKTVLKMKNDIFSAILETKISEFNQSNSAKYISIFNNDIKVVNESYIGSIMAMIKDIATMIFALGAMAFLSPVNALIALALSSSPLIVPAIFGKQLSRTNITYMKKMAALNEKVKDFLLGFEVIKTFSIEKNIIKKFFKSTLESEKSRYNAGKVSVKVGTFSGTILVATQIITYLVAGYFVITGRITIGAVIAIAGLSGSIMQPIQYVSINLANIKSTKEIRDRLLNIISSKASPIRDKEADFSLGFEIKNLSFKYEAPVENKISEKRSIKPQIRMIPLDGRSVNEVLASAGIDPSNANIMDASNADPDFLDSILDSTEKPLKDIQEKTGQVSTQYVSHKGEIPLTDAGEIDIAALLAANGITDLDLLQAKVLQIDNLDSSPFKFADMNESPPAIATPEIPEGAVLRNISYTIKPGGKYAIVGGSGSGKSTLLKILMGYYDDYLGFVRINGAEIRDINRESLYSSLSIMHQNVFLLDDTLYNNITLNNPYSEEEYIQAIKKAKLSDFVQSLSEGSSTNVGEGGNILSGGERQRVAIARALIKGCKVMILDEAMANLDNETAYSIEKGLIETPALTCIFVTHRYTRDLLHLCDGILVLRNGELIENGTFDELYERKGYFYSLYNIGGR